MNIKWDSDNYTDNFQFVHKFGEDVAQLIDVPKGSFVVDLGCGNGALTEKLEKQEYRVLGLDASAEMIAKAKALHPHLHFRTADALDFSLPQQADCIFSNAVFHWIDADKQVKLLENIAANLKSRGILVCEFGGFGCAETVHRALEKVFAQHGLCYPRIFYFPTVGEYAPLIERAGMLVEYASLFDRPTQQKSAHGVADWIKMFVKIPFLGMDELLKETIIREAEKMTRPRLYTSHGWLIDYVRIRIKARKM